MRLGPIEGWHDDGASDCVSEHSHQISALTFATATQVSSTRPT